MGAIILRNGIFHLASQEIVEGEGLAIANQRILPLEPELVEDPSSEELDVSGLHVSPGLIDLLVNGCAGVNVDNELTSDGLERMRRWQLQHGTLSFVPTLISGPRETLSRTLDLVREFKRKHPTVCPGLHLEGPFISSERKGFHPVGYIRHMGDADIQMINDYKDTIAYISLAPEQMNAKYLTDLITAGIRVSAGHTNCTFMEAVSAMKAGIHGVTHLYNGMRPVSGRDPGIIGAVLFSKNVLASVIADGRHVHPALIRLCHHMLDERLFIVSDAVSIAGDPDRRTSFNMAGAEIFVDKQRGLIDGKGSLAGTNICLLDSVQYLIRACGYDLDQALEAATLTPAKMLGIEENYGSIEPGKMADLIVFDDEFHIRYVINNGFLKTSAELL